MTSTSRRSRNDTQGTTALVVLTAILLLAPFYRGGNRPLALLLLELVAVAGLAVALLPQRARPRIPLAAAVLAGFVVFIPLLQLVPLPLSLWAQLPGREPFVATLRDVAQVSSHAISLVPFETEYALLALLPPLAAFFLSFQLRLPQVIRLLQVLVGIAVIEAIVGLVQYGLLGGAGADMRATGTFVNPNHFAGFLVMVLPIAVMGLAVEIGDRTRERVRGRGLVGVFKRAVASKGIKVMSAVVIIVLLLVAIVFSRSRAGIALAALGLALTTITAAPRIGGPRAYGVMGLVLAVVVGLAAAIGLLPVIDRFAEVDAFEDERWPMIVAAIQMAGRYFPVGSGAGTFAALYPPFQPAEILTFVHRAHNDYVEWVVEGGILAFVAIVLGIALYIARVVLLAREPDKHRVHFLQVGAAIGIFLMALHGFVDFNLRIPANAIVFALLCGLLLTRHQAMQLQEQRRDRHARMPVTPMPLAPVPQLDPEAAARVRAVWSAPDPIAALPVALRSFAPPAKSPPGAAPVAATKSPAAAAPAADQQVADAWGTQ